VRTTKKQSRRLSILSSELLDLTRIRLGRLEIFRKPCDIVPLIRNVAQQLNSGISNENSKIIFHETLPIIGEFDSGRIEQVTTNLLTNAIKYGKEKPIDIFVRQRDQKL